MGQRGRKRIAVVDARLGDLPGQPLGNLGDLGDASPFRNQTWNIDAGRQKAAVSQSFDVESDHRFVHGFHIAVSESLLGPWYAGRRSGFYRARCQRAGAGPAGVAVRVGRCPSTVADERRIGVARCPPRSGTDTQLLELAPRNASPTRRSGPSPPLHDLAPQHFASLRSAAQAPRRHKRAFPFRNHPGTRGPWPVSSLSSVAARRRNAD